MNVLFVSAILPYPLYSGGAVRIFNLLSRLSKKHTITLFAFTRSEKERQYATKLPFCEEVRTFHRGSAWQAAYIAKTAVSSYPFLMNTYRLRAMQQAIADGLSTRRHDLLHIEPGYVYPSVGNVRVPLVISEHNIEHHIYRAYAQSYPVPLLRPILLADAWKMKRWERLYWGKAGAVTVVSEEDASYIRNQGIRTPVHVVPNGVDTDFFPFRTEKAMTKTMRCIFVGNFSWMQNRDAVKYLASAWPSVLASNRNTSLVIIGKNAPDTLRKTMASSGFEHREHVKDIRKELRASDVALAPIRVGGGTQYKILEAMASGVPVVTTRKGAEGLRIKNGIHCMIAETKEELSGAISTLRKSPDKRRDMARQARSLIENHYAWDRIADILNSVWVGEYEKKN